MPDQTPTTIPLVEEHLEVSTRKVETGRVRVETQTEFVKEFARAQLESAHVDVERVAVGKVVGEAPEIRTVGNVTIVPVLEEILVVEKRLVLKEELHITRRVTTEEVNVPISLRKQRAIVTKT